MELSVLALAVKPVAAITACPVISETRLCFHHFVNLLSVLRKLVNLHVHSHCRFVAPLSTLLNPQGRNLQIRASSQAYTRQRTVP